jgi:hypothetical protein
MAATLDISKQFTADDGSAVCLVKLGSLAKLLRDEHGDVRRSMLEPNVRDYQGAKNIVNKAIRQSLAEATAPEFWWLKTCVAVAVLLEVVGNDHLSGLESVTGRGSPRREGNDRKGHSCRGQHAVQSNVPNAGL